MSEANICQSCGVPLKDEYKAVNADGTLSSVYCSCCYEGGSFTHEMTMEDMMEMNLQYVDEWNKLNGKVQTPEEARKELNQLMPTLKRWKKD